MRNDNEAHSALNISIRLVDDLRLNNEKISAVPIYIERRETLFYRII